MNIVDFLACCLILPILPIFLENQFKSRLVTPLGGVTNLNLKLFSENIGKMRQLAKTNQHYSLKK
jgi:hypothetical protein